MNVVKLPKNFRMACYDVMDDKEGSLEAIEKFSGKFPHQVAAVLAEADYFDGNFSNALDRDITVLPWFDEWHYSNVKDEHMAAMTTAAIVLNRQGELIDIFEEEKIRLQGESGNGPKIFFLDAMIECLKTGVMPCNRIRGDAKFKEAVDPKSKEELIKEVKLKNKKIEEGSVAWRTKLFTICRLQGYPQDALEIFEDRMKCKDEMSELDYIEAIKLYRLFEKYDEAMKTVEELATSRLWVVASATQVRPMSFFLEPVLCPYLLESDSLSRIRKASIIDNGSLIRK